MVVDFQARTNNILRRLRFLGVWFKRNIFHVDLYFFYAIWMFLFYNFHSLTQVMYIIEHYDEMSVLTSSGLLTAVELFTIVKAYCVIKHKSKILRLNSIMQKNIFQPKNLKQEDMTKSTLKVFDNIYFIHTMAPILSLLFFSLYPIADLRQHKRRLPFEGWYPYNITVSPYFELTYFHQIMSCIIASQIHVATDCLSFYFIAFLVVQVDLLTDNLKNINSKNHGNFEKTDLDKELSDCIKHHKEILSCLEEVYQILNGIMFGQFIISGLSLCLTLVELSVIVPGSGRFIALLTYELAIMAELLMFCWWGNELMVKSQLLPQAAFESDWIGGSITFKKNLSFFIFRTQKDMVLYAADFFKISLSSFLLILKNSYSFYAVLRHVNSKEV